MPQDKVPGNIQGRTVSFEDSSFVSGESPVVHNIKGALKHNAVDGYIVCDGQGDILVEFSDDGTNYGGQHTLQKNDVLSLKYLNVNLIRITHSGTDSSYRILVI